MPYTSQVPVVEHGVIKPQRVIDTAIGIVERELVLPKFFTRKDMSQFQGAEGDRLTFRYPGVLPYRYYEWRNDRTDALIFDNYNEAKADIEVNGRLYSGVRITDEQFENDFVTPGGVLPMQAAAIARGAEQECAAAFRETAFPVLVGDTEADHYAALLEARRLLNRLTGDTASKRVLLVGSDYASSMLQSERLTIANKAGDQRADNAVSNATLGTTAGFDVVESGVLAADEAFAITGNAFTMWTGAPIPPQEIMAASRSFSGLAMTWLRDYEAERLMRRSILVSYIGTSPAVDFLQKFNPTTRLPERSPEAHFVRGVKLKLGGASAIVNPDVNAFAELYAEDSTGWVPPTKTIK